MADYYIKNPGGNDGNTGLSDAQAWLTIAKVNSSMGSFNAGDTISFNKGDEWQDALEITCNGSIGNHITIGAYGTGADPIINGAAVHATWVVADDVTADTMILNGKFTADTTSWTAGQSAVLASIAGGQDGNCLRITEGGADSPEARQAFTKGVTAGDEIEVSFYVKQGTESTYNAMLYDVTNGYVQIWAKGGAEATGSWVKHTSGTQTVPAGCTEVQLRLRNVAANGSGKTLLFDEVAIFNPNVFKKDVTNTPGIAIEDDTFLTRLDWDTDTQTTFDASPSGSWSNNGSVCYVRCTDDADPDTHTMEVAASAGNDRYCIYLLGSEYITIDGIKVQYSTLDGIKLQGNLANGGVTNVIIQNCTAYACGLIGIKATENVNTSHDYNNTLTIDTNTVSYCGRHGIMLQNGTSDSTVSSNTVSYCGWVGTNAATGGHGISQWGTDTTGNPRDNIIESNTVHHQYEATDRTEGAGIQCDGNTQDSIVRYNLTHTNEGSGLYENGLSGNSWYYNISYGNGNGGASRGGMTVSQANNCSVYNNVFYNNDTCGIFWFNGSQVSLTIKNNIFAENADYEIKEGVGGGTGLTCDYNCVYHSAGGTFMKWEATDYNWADWLTNSNQDANSINSDPRFKDATNDDFHLNTNSPCRDIGIDVGLTRDYDGNAVPLGPGVDIGAFEYPLGAGTWQSYADKMVNTPKVLVEIQLNSGTRLYSKDYIRGPYDVHKGNILEFPQIRYSIGDMRRTYERNKIIIVFNDTDYEFRTLETDETVGLKNIRVIIKIAFEEDDFATPLIIFDGIICDWRRLDNLQFEIEVEEQSHDLDNKHPDKLVDLSDYANTVDDSIGQVIAIPYGSISALGLSADGAFGYPSLNSTSGLPMIDDTVDAEKHLVGRQAAAITVDRVYLDGAVQTAGGGNDYQISTQVIGGMTHTEIHWEAGANPTVDSLISCDITFGTRGPVEAIRHFLENFCGYSSSDFSLSSYNTAVDVETDRGYSFDGALYEKETLDTILDRWRNEFELDIYWNKDGDVCFKYTTSSYFSGMNEYKDFLHMLVGNDSDPQVSQLMNYLEYEHTFHYSKGYHYYSSYYEDSDSQTKYGETKKEFIKFYWIRSSSIASDITSRKVIRRKDPIILDTYRLPLKAFSQELTEAVKITHYEGGGDGGHSDQIMLIRDMTLDIDNFVSSILVEDSSSFIGKSCILGDGDILPADWDGATQSQRIYCYLCDVTSKKFDDGSSGKRLFN